jgi:probable F420-dependent oxidoreductase
MTRPFRFGVQLSRLPTPDWAERLRLIERLGYSTVLWPDHFGVQWEPVAALAAAAAVTQRLNVGSLVYDVDYRHPVVLAKAAATIHLLSGGRHEFGIGAGWMETDYEQAGMPYDRAAMRIERLEEALTIIRSMWREKRTTFDGKHYRIHGIAQAAELPEGSRPRILIGGGGRKVLSVAARHADIIGVNPRIPEGRVTRDTAADLAPERVREKLAWIEEAAEAAGRDPGEIELSTLAFLVAITDDPSGVRRMLSSNTGLGVEEVTDSPLFITGSASEVRDRFERRREETGISYVVIQGEDPQVLERFAEAVVGPLAGK